MGTLKQHFYSHASKFSLLGLLVLMSACSTMTEGSSQRIAVHSVPEGAACVLRSNNEVIAEVASTPEVLTVSKSKYDIVVECTKDGYQKGKNKDHSDFAVSSLGNMVFGQFGIIGNMVDSATGAGNKYDSQVFVELEKNAQDLTVAQAAPALVAQPFVHAAAPPQTSVTQVSTSLVSYNTQTTAPMTPQMPVMQQAALQGSREAFPSDFAVPDSMERPPFN